MFRHAALLAACALSSACAVDLTCDEPQAYESAREGARVAVPDDLDPLQASREQQIPQASPREPRPPGSPCLDLPPTLRSGADSNDADDSEGEGD